ncbi:MAG TPA: LLM class flavin-dependent oxidoreductase, partial [Acidimicrobiales bacterium]
ADRFDEFTRLLDRLLREPVTTHRGDAYVAEGFRRAPGCVQRPRVPFAVAATGPVGMRLVADVADTWVTNGDRSHRGPPLPPEAGVVVVRRQLDRLAAACADAGRDLATLDRLVLTGPRLDPGLASPAAFREAVDAYAEAGVTDLVVHWPRPDAPYAGDPTVLERILG